MLPDYLIFSDNPQLALKEALEQINPDHVAIVVDENTKKHCLPLLNHDLNLIELQSGEVNKNLESCKVLWEEMTDLGFSRNSLLINLGGGVIGDMGGFAAATYKRGIRFINFPTTLLSMVDASIGGKLGIDFNGLKNHIGVFNEPQKVIVCPTFLATLEKRQIRSGFAEVLKHALIADLKYWESLKEFDLDNGDFGEIIKTSAELKQEVVSQDPKEAGRRKILNFGHSLGHAIETHLLESKSPLLHGEAIAIGMVLESHISLQKKLIEEDEFSEVVRRIQEVFEMPPLPAMKSLVPFLQQDKKNQGDSLNFSLIDGIGSCKWDMPVFLPEIQESLQFYQSLRQTD